MSNKTPNRSARRRAGQKKIISEGKRPSNLLIFLLIFGIIFVFFAGIFGYRYFSKPATIQKFLKENKETYKDFYYTESTLVKFSAKKNSLLMTLTVEAEDEYVKEAEEFYKSDDGKDQFKYMAAAYLTEIKPQTRALSADVTITVSLNEKEMINETMTYKEAKDFMKEMVKKYEESEKEDPEEE